MFVAFILTESSRLPARHDIWPADLLEKVRELVSKPSREMRKPEFEFELTSEAALKNFLVLKKYGLNLEAALEAQKGTPLEYGSEFRTVEELAPIFSKHPYWDKMQSLLTVGSSFPLKPLEEEVRIADLEAALARGNHKGAKNKPDLLRELVNKDVVHGYALPIPLSRITRVPRAVLAPLNIAAQNTINEFGQIIAKDRLTHDQSFDFSERSSVNSRVIEEKVLPVRYGHCIKRIINWAVSARNRHPNVKIFASKTDFKSAYRRVHMAWETALQSCTQLTEEEIAIISLRLTFGGSVCPAEWCVISEAATDLANAILHHPSWDPSELFSPLAKDIPKRIDLPDDVPFGVGRELVVDIELNEKGMSDVFIDDTFAQTLDLPGSDNVVRVSNASLLAIHAIARPLLSNEPIPREAMAALAKLIAEAGAEETKIMLGWFLNLRELTISLPDNKATAWTQEIIEMLEEGKTQAKRLERNLGRFVNIGMILPYVHHFLSRIRTLLKKAKRRQSAVLIPIPVQEDLKLMRRVIERANKGVDMNILAHRMPDHVHRNDSCPFRMGGYAINGKAWRWIIPADLRFRATNNLLEHLANITTIKIRLLSGEIKKGDCVLSMSDSMVSTSWLRKSNFDEEPDIQDDGTYQMDPIQAEVRAEVAREHALMMMENEICEYEQWFEGRKNVVADALSRDDNRDDETLTKIILSSCPEQVPPHFEIVPPPKEVVSWLTSVLQKLPVREQLREQHTRSKLGRGDDGVSGQKNEDLGKTHSWTDSPENTRQNCWADSPKRCDQPSFQSQLMKPWLKSQSEMPSHMWQRPFGTIIGQTQPSTKMVSLQEFYHGNTEHTETQTHL